RAQGRFRLRLYRPPRASRTGDAAGVLRLRPHAASWPRAQAARTHLDGTRTALRFRPDLRTDACAPRPARARRYLRSSHARAPPLGTPACRATIDARPVRTTHAAQNTH